MFPTFSLFSLALLAAKGAIGALLTDPTQLTTTTYDYVIVGAGTAGSVLAARLTEDANVKVLVVEAGRSNEGSDNANIRIPFNAPLASPGTSFDWNFTTVDQASLNNEPEPYPRGKHSSIVAPADGHDTTGEFDPAWHGNGPLLTSVAGYPAVIDPLVIGTTQEAPEFPYNVDGNSGNPLGISWAQSTIANGTRQSSAIAYLWPAMNRPNLDVLIHTQATRLIQTGRTGSKPIFRSVEFATGPSAPRFRATARREVILSAGSVGTPQLLQLSGIGNRDALSALGIHTIVNNPDVGEHLQVSLADSDQLNGELMSNILQDHPFIPLQWEVSSNQTFDQLFYNADLSAAALNQWNTDHTGPLSTNPVMNHIGFLRIPEDNAIWQENEDPSAGPNSPHYEIAFGNCFVTTSAQTVPSSGGYMTITPIVVSPSSRGYVRLGTSNPFDAPLIDPGFFSNDLDMAIMIEAVKASQRYVATSSWSNFIGAPYIDSANTTTPEGIIEYTRQRTATTRHPTGTAQVGKVVNGDLTVKDISGVRIVDASIFPHVPSAHTQAPTYIIAERAADLIKAAYH
ncbi:hypothetical protein EYR40_000266 [Pleurotus pulmonarius]|nr:hypothetical protein EYR40_000266 [Pleurotus pulmonarius]